MGSKKIDDGCNPSYREETAWNKPRLEPLRLKGKNKKLLNSVAYVQNRLVSPPSSFTDSLNRQSEVSSMKELDMEDNPSLRNEREQELSTIIPLLRNSHGVPYSSRESILEFLSYLKGRYNNLGTIKTRFDPVVAMIKHGVNLYDDKDTLRFIDDRPSSFTKNIYLISYENWLDFKKIQHSKFKRYPSIMKFPYVPSTKDIDQLISALGKRYGTLIQLGKETGFRIGEALRLRLMDFDLDRNIVTLNDPEKNSLSRQVKISDKLVSMIKYLTKDLNLTERIWKTSVDIARHHLMTRKLKISKELGNPNIARINFKSLRHYRGSTLYSQTKDLLFVQSQLGHKDIKNTMIYTHLIAFEDPEAFYCKIALTVDEASKLIESGFDFVLSMDDVKMFRKRK